jgi:hypothetical protein
VSRYLTDADLAEKFGRSREWVQAQCRGGWPHMKVGKSYRFTDEQVAQIEAMLTPAAPAAAPAPEANPFGYRGRAS